MKIKDGFLMRNVAGKNIVVSVGAEINFSGMLTLNDTGVFFWNQLQNNITREELLEKILSEYDIDRTTALKDIDAFIEKLRQHEILEG